ncbi:MAG: lipoate protein ligase C-terminal domain-containing protein [Candidatus Hodarchaeota archaeon]
MGSSTYKVPDGKMIKVRLEVENNRIQSLTILGDFFLHPEDTIIEIEKGLLGSEAVIDELSSVVTDILEENKAILIGATANDIARAIMMAVD